MLLHLEDVGVGMRGFIFPAIAGLVFLGPGTAALLGASVGANAGISAGTSVQLQLGSGSASTIGGTAAGSGGVATAGGGLSLTAILVASSAGLALVGAVVASAVGLPHFGDRSPAFNAATSTVSDSAAAPAPSASQLDAPPSFGAEKIVPSTYGEQDGKVTGGLERESVVAPSKESYADAKSLIVDSGPPAAPSAPPPTTAVTSLPPQPAATSAGPVPSPSVAPRPTSEPTIDFVADREIFVYSPRALGLRITLEAVGDSAASDPAVHFSSSYWSMNQNVLPPDGWECANLSSSSVSELECTRETWAQAEPVVFEFLGSLSWQESSITVSVAAQNAEDFSTTFRFGLR